MSSDTKKATLKGLFALASWAFAASVASGLSTIPPYECLSIIFLLAFLTTKVRLKNKNIIKNRFRFFVIGSILMFCNQFFYIAAFHFTSPEKVELVYYIWPILFFLLIPIFQKQGVLLSHLVSSFLGLLGIYVLFHNTGHLQTFTWLEIAFPFICAISWAIYMHLSTKEKSLEPAAIGLFFGILFPVAFLTHLMIEPFIIPTIDEALLLLIMGVFIMGFSYSWWEEGVRHGQTNWLTLVSFFNPVWSIALLILLGKSEASYSLFVATAIILLATVLPNMIRRISSEKTTL